MKWMRVRDIAKLLNVSERTVYNRIKAGDLRAWKMGRTWMIGEDEIEHMLQTEFQKVHGPIAPNSSSTAETELDTVKRALSVAEEAVRNGIVSILEPRRVSEEAGIAINKALDKAHGEVLIAGVGLPEFFSDEGKHSFTLHRMKREGRKVNVRVLMVHPLSDFSHARTILEMNREEVDEEMYRTSSLYTSSVGSLRVISEMQAGTEENPGFTLEVKFTKSWPFAHLIITDTLCFAEIYHFGRTHELSRSSSEGAVPIFVCKANSALYRMMKTHFEYVWTGRNKYITNSTPEDVREDLYRDRYKAS